MRAVVVAVGGGAAVWLLARAARRAAVRDRFRPRRRVARAWLPRGWHARVERALAAAAFAADVDTACVLWATAIGVGAVLGFAFGGPPVALGGALVGLLGAPVAVLSLRHREARRIAAAVPETLERVASELRAGGTISTAIRAIGNGEGALAADCARVDGRVRLGATLAEALHDWSSERAVPGIDAAAGALAMCATVGGRSADALDGLATSLRDRLAVAAEADALSAQARLSALVVGGGPVAYLAWSALVDPRSVHALVATAVGRACLAVGLVLELLGAWWMRRIVRSGSIG